MSFQDLRFQPLSSPSSIHEKKDQRGGCRQMKQKMRSVWDHSVARRQGATLNQLPQYRVALHGFHVHFVHVRSKHPKPLPLSITHGWPRSFVEMVKLIPLLTDPVAYGGSAEDAFDVIVPSLPGYGFSDRPTERGMNPFKDTGSGFKDDKLKSEDFFYAEHDPYITFKSSKIVQTGPTTFDVPGTFTSGCAIFTFSAWGSR